MPERRRAAVAGLGVGVALLIGTACGSSEPVAAPPTLTTDRATEVYLPLAQRLGREMARIAQEPPALTPLGTSAYLAGDNEGSCHVSSQVYTVDTWFGRDRPWRDLTSALAKILGPHTSFRPGQGLVGGFDGQDAIEPTTGVDVRLRAKGSTTLQVVVPVKGSCDVHGTPLQTPPA